MKKVIVVLFIIITLTACSLIGDSNPKINIAKFSDENMQNEITGARFFADKIVYLRYTINFSGSVRNRTNIEIAFLFGQDADFGLISKPEEVSLNSFRGESAGLLMRAFHFDIPRRSEQVLVLNFVVFSEQAQRIRTTVSKKQHQIHAEEITFTAFPEGSRLQTPELALYGQSLIWNKDAEADFFLIFLNDEITFAIEPLFDFDHILDEALEITVVAISRNYQRQNSMAATIIINRLSAPEVYFVDGYLRWNKITNALNYDVFFGGQVINTQTNSFALAQIPAGMNLIRVQAHGDTHVISSALSQEVLAHKLATPVLTGGQSLFISWESIDFADYYEVFINNVFVLRTAELRFRKVIGQNQRVTVRAINTSLLNVVSSDFSLPFIYTLA
ncbi:MAG: hypothetical protein FWE36_06650 [Erysipelotrichales bacterium]|nr:hypothetical protein [Erysipelotrichales bacterium]